MVLVNGMTKSISQRLPFADVVGLLGVVVVAILRSVSSYSHHRLSSVSICSFLKRGKEDDFVILRRSLRNYCCHFRPRTTTRDDLANDVVGDVVVDDALK